jgi:divalent metal cation (Fe/Co/Zn/Cd) transporter
VWDGIGTLFIGLLLVCVAVVLSMEMKSLLIGESATKEHVDLIRAAIADHEDIERVIHMRTQHLGPEELLVAVKIGVRGASTAADISRAIDDAEARIRAAVPIARVIYIEPAIYRVPDPT